MKYTIAAFQNKPNLFLSFFLSITILFAGCKQKEEHVDLRIKQMNPYQAADFAKSIESIVKPELADSLTLKLWCVDSLVISPVAIDLDDSGKLYYTTTNSQKNSEFDIRARQDWQIASI